MSEAAAAQKAPHRVELMAGEKYFWCTCGRSAKGVFCDGAHKGTGLHPHVFVAERDEIAHLCGCGKSGRAPFCDGTHAKP